MNVKETNPKDAIGTGKWRTFSTIPLTVIAEVGVALLEGAKKYGRHNYRVAGVRSSVYLDASIGHIMQWWEGEDIDKDSGLNHITKAIASLIILRDAMIQDKLNDDRPPKGNLDIVRNNLQSIIDTLSDKYPEPKEAHKINTNHYLTEFTKKEYPLLYDLGFHVCNNSLTVNEFIYCERCDGVTLKKDEGCRQCGDSDDYYSDADADLVIEFINNIMKEYGWCNNPLLKERISKFIYTDNGLEFIKCV